MYKAGVVRRIQPLARSNATNQVLEKLRIHILTNQYADGEQVTENMLAERYMANRSSVRNALLVLERESLIRVAQNGTKQVCRFTEEDAKNLYDLRSYIELDAVKLLYALPERDFTYALESMKNASSAVQSRDVAKIIRADADFHCACVHLCGNKALMQTWIALSPTTEALFWLNMNDSLDYKDWYVKTFVQRHTALLATLMSDPEACSKLLATHIEDACNISCGVIRRIGEGKLATDNNQLRKDG
jgi:DNA-binding GntR family transcriptional regulator